MAILVIAAQTHHSEMKPLLLSQTRVQAATRLVAPNHLTWLCFDTSIDPQVATR
jgi:hypothetical protein